MIRVTALITVFNEQEWIVRAAESILNQTVTDIELLIIDDGSTDATPDRLASINDPRMRVLRRDRMGRAAALALGVEEAKGDYIAILDADDEAYLERFEKQIDFLDAHRDVAWLGCGEERRDTQRGESAMRLYPSSDMAIRRMATRCIPYSHSGVMFRKSLLNEGLNYSPKVPFLIDFDFFLRIAERHKVANLDEVLVIRRLRDESFFQSSFKRRTQNRALARLSAGAVRRFKLPIWYLGYPLARLGYDLFPNNFKRILRRIAGIKEKFEVVS